MILVELFLTFMMIGLFGFGGGYAILPVVEREAMNHSWLTKELFNRYVGFSNITPGPVSIKMATWIGLEQGGFFGSLVATIGFALPGLILTYLVLKAWDKYNERQWFQNVNFYLISVIGALFVQTAILLFSGVPFSMMGIVIFVIIFLLALSNKISSIVLLLLGGLLGMILL
ncbi:hypothetical protein AZF37_03795 [endosymbiont 'TC1' of Trimyema compressum]|uniref:chromate transporter n=1 Tax=endosymbiont 'TC1' of Trimyema compressum TaxID=243899 RepID=UPI0007F0E08D|nr:chromate transporter [endosymbiont 'TC1' of Trimyema compressum]AMP20407.1 hypothetical protein AZF37_03795 [endosymbiont 'TC1' of Trimyema compressum]